MSVIRYKPALAIVALAALVALVMVACGGPNQYEIIQTFEAEERVRITTATAESLIAQGLDPDAVVIGGAAATAQAERQAEQTAEAESGGSGSDTESGGGTGSGESTDLADVAAAYEPVVPDGPAQEGEVTVEIDQGVFTPEVVKVKVGTTVIWNNLANSASSSASLPGEAEQWDTDGIWRSAFNPEQCCGQHTFTIVGCHRYRSLFSGDVGVGAVCVVE